MRLDETRIDMARIAGVDLPRTKRVEIGLTYIYGIGRVRSNSILKDAGVSPDIRVKDLSEDDVRKISRVIEEQGGVEGDLRKEISMNIKRLMEIGCYRGMRHRRGLPVRGQRTTHQRADAQGPAQGRDCEEEDGLNADGQELNAGRRLNGAHPKAPHREERRRGGQAEEDLQEARREARRPPRAGAHPRLVQQHRR